MDSGNVSLVNYAIRLTEREIERIAEREMDKLDKQFLNGKLSVEQYDKLVASLDRWTSNQYAYAKF